MANEIKLRSYQTAALEEIHARFEDGTQRTCLVLATGLGKTTVFSELARQEVARGGKVLVLAHRDELLDQAAKRMEVQCGLAVGKEIGKTRWTREPVVVASVATVGREKSSRPEFFQPTLVVCDEAHHAAANTYMNVTRRLGCFERGGPKYLGVTATPHRMDNKPLHGSESAIFENVAYNYGIRDGILDAWLTDIVPYRAEASYRLRNVKTTAGDYNQKELAETVNNERDNQVALATWMELARDRQTIVFCVNVEHSQTICDMFTAIGVSARHADGATPPDIREAIVNDFRMRRFQVLVNCMLFTEGFDAPEVSCVMVLRPTKSWSLYTQMVGRGVRPQDGVLSGLEHATPAERLARIQASDKPDCIVIEMSDGEVHNLAQTPNMNALVGLNRHGRAASLREAMQLVDDLNDAQKRALAAHAQPFDWASVDKIVTRIDLLTPPQPVPQLRGVTGFKWREYSPGVFVCDVGPCPRTRARRRAIARENLLGMFEVYLEQNGKQFGASRQMPTLEEAVCAADRAMGRHWPEIQLGMEMQRNAMATPRQVDALFALGVPREHSRLLTMNMASEWIARLRFEKEAQLR